MVCVMHEARPENLMAIKKHDCLKQILLFYKCVEITYSSKRQQV